MKEVSESIVINITGDNNRLENDLNLSQSKELSMLRQENERLRLELTWAIQQIKVKDLALRMLVYE